MGALSRDKGQRGELEVAEIIRKAGFEAHRGRQYSGGDESPDVAHSIPGVHFEVKRTEKLALWQAIEQAKRDAGDGRVPVVAHRPNRREWIAVVSLDYLLQLLRNQR